MKTSTKSTGRVLLVMFLMVSAHPSLSYSTESITKEFDSTETKLVSIENDSGNVQLSSHDKKLITVEARFASGTKDTCDVQIEKNLKEVFVKIKSRRKFSIFSSNKCEVNVIMKSPRLMNLGIKNGSGDIRVSDLEGTLNAKNGSGDLSVQGSFSEANVSVGSGNVSISGAKGPGVVNVGSGDAAVSYSSLPQSGDLKVNIGSGNLTIRVPKQSSVQTKVRMGSGSQKNYLDNSSPGKFLIDGNIGSGDLILRNI